MDSGLTSQPWQPIVNLHLWRWCSFSTFYVDSISFNPSELSELSSKTWRSPKMKTKRKRKKISNKSLTLSIFKKHISFFNSHSNWKVVWVACLRLNRQSKWPKSTRPLLSFSAFTARDLQGVFDIKKWWISKVDLYALPFSLGGSLWLPLPLIEISLSEKWCNDIWSMVSGNFFFIKKQEQYLVLVSKGPFVPDLTIICLKSFHTWNSVHSTWVFLFICFCTSILSFWNVLQFSKVRDHRHDQQAPRVWGSCSSARRVCWRMPWLFLNIGSSNCKSQPLSMEMLTPKKDLETHICRSISVKAIYPLNEKNINFSNLVASLRKLLCELTIVPHGNKVRIFCPRAYESMAIPFRFLKFWQSADLSKPLGHPNRLAVPLSSRSFPRSWECGIYLSRSGGKMEGYHPAAVLMTFEYEYIHSPSIDIGRTSSVWLSPVSRFLPA